MQREDLPRRIVFVCTGNIFRSLTAEVALRSVLPEEPTVQVSSAGTDDFPHVVQAYTQAYLLHKGFDVRTHRRRTLSRDIVGASHLVVSMSTEHQAFIRERFGRETPLFIEACGFAPEWLPDIEEAVPDYRTNRRAAQAHVRNTIDLIVELAPRILDNLDALIRKYP